MTYESRGQRVFDVVKGTQVNAYTANLEQSNIRYTEDMLPEDLTRKLAVLQMLDSEDFVDGVGVSAGHGVYYVFAERRVTTRRQHLPCCDISSYKKRLSIMFRYGRR